MINLVIGQNNQHIDEPDSTLLSFTSAPGSGVGGVGGVEESASPVWIWSSATTQNEGEEGVQEPE